MTDKKIKSIVDQLKGEIEAKFVREYMEDGYANMDSLMEYAVQEYEEENEIEFSEEDFEKFTLYFNEEVYQDDVIEDIKQMQYEIKYGKLASIGMSEKDFM